MASSKNISYVSEWELDEEYWEESGIGSGEGEEAGRALTRNEKAWNSCDKLRADGNYHQRYIPLKDAFGFRNLSSEDKEKFIKEKALTEEEKMFLSSEKAVKCLESFAAAVVCITVTLPSSQAYGTGFFIRVNDEDVVITNSHSIRSSHSGKGVDFRHVKEKDVRVISFYDGKGSSQVSRDVLRIDRASPPDKNKDKDVLKDYMKGKLHGGGKSDTPDISKLDTVLQLLSPYFSRRDAFLDYALLYLVPLENDEQKAKFSMVKPLEMKRFEKLVNSRSLRLLAISHPHRASKQVSFGGMLSDLAHVYSLNWVYGQNDIGMEEKDPFAEHSITTCRGSSGAPIFVYIVNHGTGEVEVEDGVYFLHFYGDEKEGKFRGKAVSFATIIRNLPLQGIHSELADALAEVRMKSTERKSIEENEDLD